MRTLLVWTIVVAAVVGAGCSDSERSPRSTIGEMTTQAPPEGQSPSPTSDESALSASGKEAGDSWRRPRYISVERAVRRLQPHVDVPVVLPRDRWAGLPHLKGWLADPKYLEWRRVEGRRVGELKLLKGRRMLLISYGLSGFDGCGGRDHAIETNVLGQPALLSVAREHLWSHLLWPVTAQGSTGRYGLTGTFEGWQMIRLAESMEAATREALEVQKAC